MCFLIDGGTADPAVWKDWIKAIDNKEKLSKQESFEGMIKFLDMYRSFALSNDIDHVIKIIRSAKNCDDTSVPMVQQWNTFLQEALNESEGTREYLKLVK